MFIIEEYWPLLRVIGSGARSEYTTMCFFRNLVAIPVSFRLSVWRGNEIMRKKLWRSNQIGFQCETPVGVDLFFLAGNSDRIYVEIVHSSSSRWRGKYSSYFLPVVPFYIYRKTRHFAYFFSYCNFVHNIEISIFQLHLAASHSLRRLARVKWIVLSAVVAFLLRYP